MAWWIWILIGIYVAGFVLTFYIHATVLGNVTLPLVLIRSLVWPIWMATGWPQGAPLTMD